LTAGTVRLRAATEADLAVVLRHRRGMFAAMGFTDEARLAAMEQASAPFFAAGLRDGTYRGFLALADDDQVIAGGGVVLIAYQPHPDDPRPRRPFVVNMFTEPEHRRRGLARLVLEAAIDWCKAAGYATVFLHASDEGRRLYESVGFEATSEMRLRLAGRA
jgi:GNAT superfamily N-acetyltransferase